MPGENTAITNCSMTTRWQPAPSRTPSIARMVRSSKPFLTEGFPGRDLLSHDLLLHVLDDHIADYELKDYEMPVSQMQGIHDSLADLRTPYRLIP